MEFFNHSKIAKILQIFFPLIFSRKDTRLFALDDNREDICLRMRQKDNA